MSTSTAIDEQGSWRRIPAFRAWLALAIVLAAAVLMLILLMLSRESGVMFHRETVPLAPAASDEWQAEAEMLRIQAEATARDLRDILHSVGAYECPAGTAASSSDRFEAIRQRAAGVERAM